MKKILFVIIIGLTIQGVFSGCGGGEESEKDDFRPHIVRHCNEQGEIEWYYHMEEYECPGIDVDLCKHCDYDKPYPNYVKYYDNSEIIYGK
jgi:hypothetical protein